MATVSSVREFLETRRFEKRTQEALVHLARDHEASYRQVARAHGVEVGRLHKTAALVPGLLDLRRDRKPGFAA
jgi:hypothetical protein